MVDVLSGAALAAFEKILNRAIALDPASQDGLKALAGTRVHVECTLPPLQLSIFVHEGGLLLGSGAGEGADAWLRGPAPALLELLVSRSGNYSLYGKDVKARGDLEKVQRLQRLLRDLRIDWEFYLSRIIGDVPVQTLSDALGAMGEFLRRGAGSFTMDVDEYLHEERRSVPGSEELESFYRALHTLRLDIDRLAARVERVASRAVEELFDSDPPGGPGKGEGDAPRP